MFSLCLCAITLTSSWFIRQFWYLPQCLLELLKENHANLILHKVLTCPGNVHSVHLSSLSFGQNSVTQRVFSSYVVSVPFLVSCGRSEKQIAHGHKKELIFSCLLLRTVPTIVTAHTFCASRDTQVSYGWCLLIQEYFWAV